jgi:hypothetical protein
MPVLPADVLEKSAEKAKTADYYDDLTDEERAEEGLPPRPEKAPAAEPAKPAAPAAEPAAKPDEPADEPEVEDNEAIDELFNEIAGLREDIGAALGTPEPAPEGKEDPLLAAAREHDDPVLKAMAARVEELTQQVTDLREHQRIDYVERQGQKDDADFNTVRAQYVIDGKPLTVAHRDQIEDWIMKHPEAGSRLSWPELVRVVHPEAVRATRRAAKPPTDAAEPVNGSPVATIVDQGATASAAGSTWKPGPNETMETAIAEAGKRFGWKR